MNTRVGRIARRQPRFGGFVKSPSPPLEASDFDDFNNDDDEDEDASSPSDDEIST